MKCVICKHAETKLGTTTVTIERDGLTYVIKLVPAQICPNCGEDYIDENVTKDLLKSAAVGKSWNTGRYTPICCRIN